jgi:GGDEF domain-containing protein
MSMQWPSVCIRRSSAISASRPGGGITQGVDSNAQQAITALRFQYRDEFREMMDRHEPEDLRRISHAMAEVIVNTFKRDEVRGLLGFANMPDHDGFLASVFGAARHIGQVILQERRGEDRQPVSGSPQGPERQSGPERPQGRDPFEFTVPDLGPTTPDVGSPQIDTRPIEPVQFREFPDQSSIRGTPTPSPEQLDAEARQAAISGKLERIQLELQRQIAGMQGEHRQEIHEGRARVEVDRAERELGPAMMTGRLTDPAMIAQLFQGIYDRVEEHQANDRPGFALALIEELFARYPDFAAQAGGGVQRPESTSGGSDEGMRILRELEEASRVTGRPLEELVRERAEELRRDGQGELALALQAAFAHAYAGVGGATGGSRNERVESSAEINRIRQTDPQELAGEINEAGDLSGYHEEELKAIMLRLLGARSGSESIANALERIGRALPEVTAEMLRELLNGAVQNALTPSVMNGEVLREFLRYFILNNPEGAAVILFDGDSFSGYNNAFGFRDGDNAIELMSAALVTAIENLKDDLAALGVTALPGRDGGDEFIIVVIPDSPEAAANLELAMKLLMNELYAVIQQYNQDNETPIPTLSGAGTRIDQATIDRYREEARRRGDEEAAGKTDADIINEIIGKADDAAGKELKNKARGEDYFQRGGFVLIDPITGDPTGPATPAPFYRNPDNAEGTEYRWGQGGTPPGIFNDPDQTSQPGLENRTWENFTRPQLRGDTPPLNPTPEDFRVPERLAPEFRGLMPGNTDMEILRTLFERNNIEPPFVRLLEEGIRVQTQPAIHEHFAALFEAAEDGTALTKIYIEPRQMKALNDEAFIELPDGTRMPVGHAGGNKMLDDLWRALHQAMVEFFGENYIENGAAGGRDRSKRQVLVVPPGTDQQTVQELMRRAHEIFSGMIPTFTGPDGNDYPIMLEGEDGSAVPFRYNLGYAAGEITKGAYETGADGYDPAQSRYDMVLPPDQTVRNYHGPLPKQSPLEIATGFVDGAITLDADGNLPPAQQNFMDQLRAIAGFDVITPADDRDWPVAGD